MKKKTVPKLTLRQSDDLRKAIKKAAKANGNITPHKEALTTLNDKYLPK